MTWLLILVAGALVGWILRSLAGGAPTRWLGTLPVRWTVVCGTCSLEREAGPRRQLTIEVWDTYGNQYKQWRVGRWGENHDTRKPGTWLWQQIAAEIARLEGLIAQTPEHTPPPAGVVPAPDTPPVAPRLLRTGEARDQRRRTDG